MRSYNIYTRPLTVCALALLAALVTAGCPSPRNQFQQPPPPAVIAEQPVQELVTEYAYFTGVTEAVESVDISARVQGFLQEIHFEPRALVEAGQVLFTIEPDQFEQALEQAEANLARAEADLRLAEATLRRMEAALAEDAISEVQVIEQRAQRERAAAEIAAAEAQVHQAELNLSYTQVKSPIDGRVSRELIDSGNVVGPGGPSVLTRVIREAPIYAYFEIDERTHLRYRTENLEKLRESAVDAIFPVQIGLADDEGYPYEGNIDYSDPEVDPSTGTLTARGVFANESGFLEPGLFVRVRVPIADPKPQILVSSRAVSNDLNTEFVYVLNDDDTLAFRPVTTGTRVGDRLVIVKGLELGEWVLVEGLQSARPGAPVTPQRGRDAAPAAEPDDAASEETTAA